MAAKMDVDDDFSEDTSDSYSDSDKDTDANMGDSGDESSSSSGDENTHAVRQIESNVCKSLCNFLIEIGFLVKR